MRLNCIKVTWKGLSQRGAPPLELTSSPSYDFLAQSGVICNSALSPQYPFLSAPWVVLLTHSRLGPDLPLLSPLECRFTATPADCGVSRQSLADRCRPYSLIRGRRPPYCASNSVASQPYWSDRHHRPVFCPSGGPKLFFREPQLSLDIYEDFIEIGAREPRNYFH